MFILDYVYINISKILDNQNLVFYTYARKQNSDECLYSVFDLSGK